jgi:energy-coupling factor transport system ATP-binding protein
LELCLDPGDYAAVFGANGSGKSTFAYLLNGLIPHFFGGDLLGHVRVEGVDPQAAGISHLFGRVGLVIQNTDAQLFSSTVEDEIAFGLESLGLPAGRIEERIREVATSLGIEDLLRRAPETLSGGERRLAAVASILSVDPSILVLDEPFSNLDWKFAERLRSLLAGIHRSRKTLIVIEQNTGAFLRDATRLVVMDAGRCAYAGAPANAEQVLESAHLVPAYPRRAPARTRESGAPLLSVQCLGCRLAGKDILKDISFSLQPGETTAIVGENGAGKTTLIKHLNGLLRPTSGDIRLHGESIRPKPVSELARRVGLCFQNSNDQFFKPTVREELEVGLSGDARPAGGRLEDLGRLFRLSDLLDRPPQRLSEGEKRRVAIAAVTAMEPELLVLDEPTAGQDAVSKEELAGLIADLAERGTAILVVTHDLKFAQACTQRWILLHAGRVAADASPEEIRTDERLIAQGLMEPPERDY